MILDKKEVNFDENKDQVENKVENKDQVENKIRARNGLTSCRDPATDTTLWWDFYAIKNLFWISKLVNFETIEWMNELRDIFAKH